MAARPATNIEHGTDGAVQQRFIHRVGRRHPPAHVHLEGTTVHGPEDRRSDKGLRHDSAPWLR